jgi:hypothetical protein
VEYLGLFLGKMHGFAVHLFFWCVVPSNQRSGNRNVTFTKAVTIARVKDLRGRCQCRKALTDEACREYGLEKRRLLIKESLLLRAVAGNGAVTFLLRANVPASQTL